MNDLSDRFRHDLHANMARKEIEAVEAQFSSLFASRPGSEVFAHLMDMLGLFEPIESDDDVTRHNVAIELLRWAKVIRPDERNRTSNIARLVGSLLTTGKE